MIFILIGSELVYFFERIRENTLRFAREVLKNNYLLVAVAVAGRCVLVVFGGDGVGFC